MSLNKEKQIELIVRNVLIIGDTRFAEVDWSTFLSTNEGKQVFLENLAELNCEQTVTGKEKSQLHLLLYHQLETLTSVKVDN